jgi:uncharacterized protein (TIGR01244 family)
VRTRLALAVPFIAGTLSVIAHSQQVTKETIPGVRNFARLETTVACGGATGPEAMPELKKLGFASVINLREASESGANVPVAGAAAKSSGLNYIHIPFNSSSPDRAAVDRFLEAIQQPVNQPAYIHCGGGNRAAVMWMIKRLVVDRWDVDRASEEATALGMTSASLRQFAIDYATTRTGRP